MSDLKPCPFCGEKAFIRTQFDHGFRVYTAACTDPCCEGHCNWLHGSKELAVSCWNTRPVGDELRSELAEAQRKLEIAIKVLRDRATSCEGSYYDRAEGIVNEFIAEAQEALREIDGGDHD